MTAHDVLAIVEQYLTKEYNGLAESALADMYELVGNLDMATRLRGKNPFKLYELLNFPIDALESVEEAEELISEVAFNTKPEMNAYIQGLRNTYLPDETLLYRFSTDKKALLVNIIDDCQHLDSEEQESEEEDNVHVD